MRAVEARTKYRMKKNKVVVVFLKWRRVDKQETVNNAFLKHVAERERAREYECGDVVYTYYHHVSLVNMNGNSRFKLLICWKRACGTGGAVRWRRGWRKKLDARAALLLGIFFIFCLELKGFSIESAFHGRRILFRCRKYHFLIYIWLIAKCSAFKIDRKC